jgi:two-component system phosphate regulon sensor histidine kinase PhoR
VTAVTASDDGLAGRIVVACPDDPADPADLTATVNAPLLGQAIVNLIDNALKYSEPDTQVVVSGFQRGGQIGITVRDHGRGIEERHIARLFERFYRVDRARSRKLGGTGLGLAIVKHIVQAHHGEIEVESEVGKGSTFTILLATSARMTS